jgi:hypothetical protein
MADTTTILKESNPFGNINIGSLGTYGTVFLIILIAGFILVLIGVLIYIFTIKKSYYIKIHVFRKVGGVPIRSAIHTAREVAFGFAGDRLWKVAPAGIIKIKIIKWLPVGKLQSANNEYWYFIREDGEWINYIQDDLNEVSKKMGVRFVQEDMRLQRLATERLLEQRHMQKSFWDKWKDTVITVVLFLVVAVSVVIIFYQFSKLLEQLNPMVQSLIKSNEITQRVCRLNETLSNAGVTVEGLVPV